MTSPKSLKRSFDDANLDNLSPNPPVMQENDKGPTAILMTKMPADQGDDPAPSVDSSGLSSPGPSHASSSVLRDRTMQIPQQPKALAPTSKKPRLTFAEKEARRVEKEVKDRERVEEKARKEHEKETRDRQKVEDKAKKEEEKRAKDFEKDTKRLVQEEKNKVKEEEKRKRDEEKARKEEEKNKKVKSQLRLNAFFALPSLPNDGSRESPNRDGQSPSSSRRSSIASLHGSGRERSTSTTPKKAQTPDYEKLFPSFFVKAHTRMAMWNRFSASEEGKADNDVKIDRFLGQDGSSSVANTTSALRTEPDLKLLNTHLRRRQPCRGARLPVKEIVARLNGTAINPIDLTNPASHEAVQNPTERLKAIPTKFLKFAEDVRPPYIGTYTKVLEGRNATKLSRNPFVRALPLIDYDYDSEAEWEEPEEGEDLDSECEEEVEEDDGEDMEGFLDDRDADEIKKRRPIIGDLEPTYNPSLPIDPYSTSYWQPLSSIAKHEASPSRMDPPRIPLNAVNRLNLQLPNSLPPEGAKPKLTAPSIPTPAKAAKQAQVKRFIAPEVLEAFKAAVQGSDLTKLGLVEVLKKQFPKQSKSAIQDTLALVAERTGGKESEKSINGLLNHRQIRTLIRSSASSTLSSRRYSSISQNLYHRVSRSKFTGYWIVQSSFIDPEPPRHSDVTIFYLHGGGYFTSQPDTYLLFLLCVAGTILAQNMTVSIFALDYQLAPEFLYPTQLEEAVAAYEYLIYEMAIPAERVVVAGDSAGGHLVLSMLVSLHQRSPLPKPGGAIFLSPWLSLHHTPSTNADADVISAPFLKATARRFLGPARADSEEAMTDPLLEFLTPHPKTEWDAVLPSWLWVSAGTNEIMFDDIVMWTQELEQILGRERLGWEWGEGEVHDWQWLETMDEGAKKRFLQKEGSCDDFKAIVRVGKIIGERMGTGKLGVFNSELRG